MKIVVFCGGECPSLDLIQRELIESKYIICADSGANCAYKCGLTPDFIIGDMDSIDDNILEFFSLNEKVKIEIYPPEKDFTDTELALNRAIDLGADEIAFIGCTGTRVDHLMGNLVMLYKCLKKNVKGKIIDDNNEIFMISKDTKLLGHKGKTFSLMPYTEKVERLSIIGAKYCLKDYDLAIGNAMTISNVFNNTSVNISFKSGVLIVFYSID
ncbi:thiamine diphosphokinase [Clostridium sp. DL1XJH146]